MRKVPSKKPAKMMVTKNILREKPSETSSRMMAKMSQRKWVKDDGWKRKQKPTPRIMVHKKAKNRKDGWIL